MHSFARFFTQIIGTWDYSYEKPFTPWDFKKKLQEASLEVEDMRSMATRSHDFPKYPRLGRLFQWLDTPLERSGLGGRFIFAKCRKCVE